MLFMASSACPTPRMAVRAPQWCSTPPDGRPGWAKSPDVTGRLVGLVAVGVVGAGVGQVLGGTRRWSGGGGGRLAGGAWGLGGDRGDRVDRVDRVDRGAGGHGGGRV